MQLHDINVIFPQPIKVGFWLIKQLLSDDELLEKPLHKGMRYSRTPKSSTDMGVLRHVGHRKQIGFKVILFSSKFDLQNG